MIDKRFFLEEVKRLKQHYGPAHFTQQFSDLLYKSVMNLNEKDLCEVVDSVIGDYKRPPMINAFKELAQRGKYRSGSTLSDESDKRYASEQKMLVGLREGFFKVFVNDKREPNEILRAYVLFWHLGVHGESAHKFAVKYFKNMNAFELPALADLRDSNFKPKRAVEIGREKL